MPIILNAVGLAFRPYAYLQESVFEKDVVALSDHIFGPTSIYLNRTNGGPLEQALP
jgi:hypothetical protein